MSELARILNAAQPGEGVAAEELLPLVYQELRRLAASKLAGERPGQTLQPTALVHEAWLRLVGAEGGTWQNRLLLLLLGLDQTALDMQPVGCISSGKMDTVLRALADRSR